MPLLVMTTNQTVRNASTGHFPALVDGIYYFTSLICSYPGLSLYLYMGKGKESMNVRRPNINRHIRADNVHRLLLMTNDPVLFFNGHIIRTNLLTKFHEDWTKIVLKKENAPPHVGHIFRKQKPVLNSAKLSLEALAKFHKDLTINVTSKEFAMKNALN
ncbi:hypothetical protein DPMN_189640 [Dreissena polymorpha]|uniref:Uncharacterized protein n=1 Tax=Dreissena polymorpha TaxID=45954 RepID=A0A9D4IB08_DREPO|nr:hypothetical protein DPMN_189640 [Dreissena polymorpha]